MHIFSDDPSMDVREHLRESRFSLSQNNRVLYSLGLSRNNQWIENRWYVPQHKLVRVKQCHKPSPSHHHSYRCYGYHWTIPSGGLWHCFSHILMWGHHMICGVLDHQDPCFFFFFVSEVIGYPHKSSIYRWIFLENRHEINHPFWGSHMTMEPPDKPSSYWGTPTGTPPWITSSHQALVALVALLVQPGQLPGFEVLANNWEARQGRWRKMVSVYASLYRCINMCTFLEHSL